MINKVYFLVLFLFVSVSLDAQLNKNGDFEIHNFNNVKIKLTGWKYSSDDRLEYINPNYDDSNWRQLSTPEDFDDFMYDDFTGFGWFRLKLIISDSIKSRLLSFFIRQEGAIQVYANGKLVKALGVPSKNEKDEKKVYTDINPYPVNFDNDTVSVAVKYSLHKSFFLSNLINFDIYVHTAEHVINTDYNKPKEVGYFWIDFGILLALSMLHFLLFIYYPEQKDNLFYSIFVFLLGVITVHDMIIQSTVNYYYIIYSQAVYLFFGFIIIIFLQKLLYELFKLKKRFINYFPLVGIVVIIVSIFLFHNITLLLFYVPVIFIDILRAVFIGIRKKMYGYRYVVTGTVIFIIGIVYQILISNIIDTLEFVSPYIIISIYFLALPVSMSILLAKRTAYTNKNLSKQLIRVKELSAITLKQEHEKKRILENQNIELERQVKERTAKVIQQKEKIEDINKHITDSITYASRIQKAIFGNTEDIISNFKDAFIFLKPHSIVSGDFYWYTKIKNTNIGPLQIIISADCTGHGVPGAFMTVMGHDFLEEIINKQNILSPNKILQELDRRITSNLKKQTSVLQVNDGMDIAVLVYAENKQVLYYSGANNPVFYIRNNELHSIKGSRYAIGGELIGKERKKVFDLHKIKVKENDKYYIFSDGFQDQFGGERNRKFMIKPFKDLLVKTSEFNMKKQKEMFEEELSKWKEGRSQTDDILLIGVEF